MSREGSDWNWTVKRQEDASVSHSSSLSEGRELREEGHSTDDYLVCSLGFHVNMAILAFCPLGTGYGPYPGLGKFGVPSAKSEARKGQ